MQNDSDIISYTTWSLNNESPLALRPKYHHGSKSKEDEDETSGRHERGKRKEDETPPPPLQSPAANKVQSGVKHEVKTFCCCLSFFTIKSCRFHSVGVYMTLLVFIGLFEQMVQGGYLAAIMSTLQTQFNMSTSKIGFIVSSFDIMGVVATPTLSYMGSRYNKCKIIAICGFFYVMGAVIYTFPYFFSPHYTVTIDTSQDASLFNRDNYTESQDATVDMCKYRNSTSPSSSFLLSTLAPGASTLPIRLDENLTSHGDLNTTMHVCNRTQSSAVAWTYSMFIIAQLFMSIGSAPLFSLGITYLTDNIEERKHAFYTGIIYGAFALGPALGYITASVLLSKWIYLHETPPIDEKDPRWVGCWYPGLLIVAGVVFLLSAMLMSFPEHLKEEGRRELQAKRNLRRKEKLAARQERFSQIAISKGRAPMTSTTTTIAGAVVELKQVPTKLETIDEAAEISAEIDKSFEFLDSEEHGGSGTSITNESRSPTPSIFTIEPKSEHIVGVETGGNGKTSSPGAAGEGPTRRHQRILQAPREHIRHHHKSLLIKTQNLQTSLLVRLEHSHLKFKGLLGSLISLLLNLRYTLLIVMLSIECVLVAGFTNYMVLYTQHVYQIPSSKSSILVGGVVVPSAILGAILGGALVRKFNMGIEGCVRLIMVSSAIVITGIFVLLFVDCEGPISIGIDPATQSYNRTFNPCNVDCGCRMVYNPTCGVDLKSYVSPCYAGCKYSDSSGYYECDCIQMPENDKHGIAEVDSYTIMARPNQCSRHCDSKLIIFLIVLFIVVAAESLCLTPATITILKLIDKPLQPFALGVLRCANILIAYIPAPIILSILIDRTCVLWNQECIGDKGTCLEYDARGFHYWLFGASAGIKVFSCVLLVALSVYTHKALILRRKYCSQVTLYHDPSMQPTRKHKSRINSVVASSTNDTDTERETTSSLDSLSYLIRFRRSSNSDSERSQPAGAPSFANNNNNNNNNPPNTRRHTNTANNVVLKRHVVFDDDFTSLARVQTPTEMSLVGDGATPGAVVTGPMSLSSLSSDETDTSPSDQQQQTVTSTTGV